MKKTFGHQERVYVGCTKYHVHLYNVVESIATALQNKASQIMKEAN